MAFVSFFTRFPVIAEKETRCLTITTLDLGMPVGKYGFIELYCDENNCDCRKVMVNVATDEEHPRIFATIGFGWDTVAYYTEWFHGDDEMAREFADSCIEMGGVQSEYSPAFLRIWKEQVLADPFYIERIRRHYALWKKEIDAPWWRRSVQAVKRMARRMRFGFNRIL